MQEVLPALGNIVKKCRTGIVQYRYDSMVHLLSVRDEEGFAVLFNTVFADQLLSSF